MSKRTSKRNLKRANNDLQAARRDDNIRHLFDDPNWSPLTPDQRDQKYRKTIRAQNPTQQDMMDAINEVPLVFAAGAAGTGKTYIAVAKAVEALDAGKVRRIVLSRPAVEAGESLGFLPGDIEEKLSPYLRPLYDALCDRLPAKKIRSLTAEGVIEIAPVAFMRGRTLNNAFVVIDEAQNCTYGQLKMLLTRLGWHSSMVITGDPKQSDLLPGISGFEDIIEKLAPLQRIKVVNFKSTEVVRHPLVADMVSVL